MSIKFSISTVAIAAFLTLTHGAIASAEVYKTSKDQVVVTGLTAKQKYPIQAVNSKNKPVKRKDVAANTCGEALIDGAAKYKSLVVGTETIDPATLTVKTHPSCKAKKTATTVKKSKKTTTMGTTGTTTPASTGTTTAPASTGTTTPSAVPTAVPSTAPATK
jgi:hypothetical protein